MMVGRLVFRELTAWKLGPWLPRLRDSTWPLVYRRVDRKHETHAAERMME